MSAFVDKMQFLKSNIHYWLPLKTEALVFLEKNSTFHHGGQRGAWVATPLGTIGWRRDDIFCQWYTLCEVAHVSINNPPSHAHTSDSNETRWNTHAHTLERRRWERWNRKMVIENTERHCMYETAKAKNKYIKNTLRYFQFTYYLCFSSLFVYMHFKWYC